MREDWKEIELSHVCNKAMKVKRKDMPSNDTFIYLDIGGIDNHSNRIIDHKKYQWSEAPSRAQQIVQVGDVLFSTVRTYLKNIAQVLNPKYQNQICSSGFTVLRGKEGILSPKFIFYYSIFEGFLQPLNELQTGTSYPAVRDNDVFAQRIPIAPLPEQRSIVAKIEQLFSELDNGIANLKAAKDKLEIYRQAVLKKAFEGELTKEWRKQQTDLPTADELLEQIKEKHLKYYENQLTEWDQEVAKWEANGKKGKKPSKPKKAKCLSKLSQTDLDGHSDLPTNWKWVKLDEVTQRASKIKKDSLNPDDSFKYFDIGGIDNNKQRILSFKTYKWNEAPSRAQQIVKFGDTLFSTVRTYLKNIGQVDKPEYHNEICSTGFTVIRGIDSKINPKFLFYLTTSEFFIQPLNKLQVGTSYPAVKDDDVFNQPFPLCSEKEQTQIVQEIESRLSVCDNILANIEEGLEKSEALRQSILKQAFEGKLLSKAELEACRREPDWEPAEKLLERIKNEKLAKA